MEIIQRIKTMRQMKSVPISMAQDLLDWLDIAAKKHGGRSAFVRWLLQREREDETIRRVEELEKKVLELMKKTQ